MVRVSVLGDALVSKWDAYFGGLWLYSQQK